MSQVVESRDSPPRKRQKPGAACEECRRRKLRCDRRQPQCGMCQASGVDCLVITARSPRGPKRGYLKLLQARVAALENILLQSQGQSTVTPPEVQPPETQLLDEQVDLSAWEIPILGSQIVEDSYSGLAAENLPGSLLGDVPTPVPSISPPGQLSSAGDEMSIPGLDPSSVPRSASEDVCEVHLSKHRDQLYFDRVQSFMPIQHQRRYFDWRRLPFKTEAQSCLQHATWTLAASVSAHYQSIGGSLYQNARRKLEALDSHPAAMPSTELEQVQGWLLLAVYELMDVDLRRSWISAGRAFRLIRLNWLNSLDGTDLTMRTGSPLTFSERVAIRLPAPEGNFQNDQPILMGFLPEALTVTDPAAVSSFTECIVAATIGGRALSHRHQLLVRDIYYDATEDFRKRHQGINSILVRRKEAFASRYPGDMPQADPMLLFVNLMWRAIILHLYQTMAFEVLPGEDEDELLREYKKQSLAAAQDIVDLTNRLCNLNSLKDHPLTMIPLSVCVQFLIMFQKPGDSDMKPLQDLTEAIRSLKRFNNLGQPVLQLVEEQMLAGTYSSPPF
ncbi:fungal specific transcription factor domain-containing protein [Aspergillus fijiensis CBS 313.89]|uniref:Putative Zn(II)2Cys6 transcription factor n=1 Tax=Aspergillus fijiensis CBS 313.89 TaxID=1448319 RepID=A0A8G1VT78_9EURO|nr:putative Zn(II)2Cys6 transcription factor [Aspergillus fijiensis CBS 313.89]RAK70801.1 putative Zn(II)2Cys6 transcription factor [Aspergillus fijiensis CBS 313.89]